MNDRFKFRVWDKEINEMLYPIGDEEGIEFDGNGDFIGIDKVGCWNGALNCELMQSVGFKDEQDNLIYEGDYVLNTISNAVGLVEWSDDRAGFIIVYKYFNDDFDSYFGTELKIIGNIYENKELLERGEE